MISLAALAASLLKGSAPGSQRQGPTAREGDSPDSQDPAAEVASPFNVAYRQNDVLESINFLVDTIALDESSEEVLILSGRTSS